MVAPAMDVGSGNPTTAPLGSIAAAASSLSDAAGQLPICVLAALCLYALWLLPRLRRFSVLNRIPSPLPGAWVVGNLLDLKNLPLVRHAAKPDTLSLFTQLSARTLDSGHGLYRLHFFRYVPMLSKEWVLVADHELAKELLSAQNYGNFHKGAMYRHAWPLIGGGILAAPDGHEWKRTRKMANPGFHPKMLRLAVAVSIETTMKMCNRWDHAVAVSSAGEAFKANMLDEMLRLTIDVLGRTAFSYDFKSVTHATADDSVLFSAFDVILKNLASKGSISKLLRNTLAKHVYATSAYRQERQELRTAMAKLDSTVDAIISKRQTALQQLQDQSSGDGPKDLLDFLLKSEEAMGEGEGSAAAAPTQRPAAVSGSGSGSGSRPGPSLSRKTIVDNIKTFLFAGHDTTASAIACEPGVSVLESARFD
jgi:cytochrome P450